MVIAARDRAVTRRIVEFQCDRRIRNGWMGRELFALARDRGLTDHTLDAATATFTDLALAMELLHLRTAADEAVAAGAIAGDEGIAWITELERAAEAGRFFSSLTVFAVTGRKL